MVKKTFKIEYIILATFVLILFVLILNSKNICETFYNNNKQYSLESIKRERAMKIIPVSETEANQIFIDRKDKENRNNVDRMYRLIKEQEETERNNNNWWKKYKLLFTR